MHDVTLTNQSGAIRHLSGNGGVPHIAAVWPTLTE